MELKEIKEIVTNNHPKEYRVHIIDGGSKVVRLCKTNNGEIAIMGKGRKYYGHQLAEWFDNYAEWTDLKLVEHKEFDYHKRFVKRANDALKMLNESGLWEDIRKSIEHFFTLSEEEQREMVNDIVTDFYEKFYKQTYDNGKYAWVNSHQVFESFTFKKCWKSIAWRKREREQMSKQVAECIKNGNELFKRWENGYDNTIEITNRGDYKRGYYSEEFRHCGNGHYYLLFDATHAIFYEDD